MHRCLSCNQECSLFSAFCDSCRASLLERREQVMLEEQTEMAEAGGGGVVEGIHTDLNMPEGMADLMSLPRLEVVPEGTQAEYRYAIPPAQTEEKCAWTFKSGIYAVEAVDDMDDTENKTSVTQVTSVLAVPLPARRVIPRRVRRALLVFCVVAVLALLTDGVLLAVSIMRHRAAQTAHSNQSLGVVQQGISPTMDQALHTPTVQQSHSTTLFALSTPRLAFSSVQGQSHLAAQTVALLGNQQNFTWQIGSANPLPAWLHFSAMQGTVAAGVTATFAVSVLPEHLVPGVYTANLLVKAFDSHNKVLAGSPGYLQVTLVVRAPCSLNVTPAKLSFAAVLVSAPGPQTLTLTESSSCSFPVYWQVSTDTSWITFSRSSGTDTDSGGSIVVQASSADKLIGTYTAHITLQGTDSTGAPLVVSPEAITVTLTVIA